MARPRILSALPFVDRVGVRNVNIMLLLLYGSLVLFGLVTLFLIPANANIPWPLALALVFVMSSSFVHAFINLSGYILVPGYVFYPTKPWYVYAIADAIIFFSFVAMFSSYIVNSESSSGPIFSTFFMAIGIAVHTRKLWIVVFPNGLFAGEEEEDTPVADGEPVYTDKSIRFDLSQSLARGGRA